MFRLRLIMLRLHKYLYHDNKSTVREEALPSSACKQALFAGVASLPSTVDGPGKSIRSSTTSTRLFLNRNGISAHYSIQSDKKYFYSDMFGLSPIMLRLYKSLITITMAQ